MGTPRSGSYSEKALQDVPNREVTIGMVDKCRYAPIRIDLGVFWSFVLARDKVDWDDVVLESEFFEDHGDLPIVLGVSM